MSSTTTPTAPSWQRGKVAGWIVSVDHKRIGAQYLGWAGVFFVFAAIFTVWMRLQMTRPDASVVGENKYRDLLTLHGTLLVFFVAVPLVVGLATYLVPLMIGAKRIAMPGLAALSLSFESFVPWLLTLCAGVWLGAHVQNSTRGIGYIGTQGAVVFIMTLVQGFGPPASIAAGVERFAGITGGLLIVLAISVLTASTSDR